MDVEADRQLCKESLELSEIAEAELVLMGALIELLRCDASLRLGLQMEIRCVHPVNAHVDLAAVPFRPHVVRA